MISIAKTLSLIPARLRVPPRFIAVAALALLVQAAGCESVEGVINDFNRNRTVDRPPAPEPGATFTGEPYLRGTIASYGRLINNAPTLVSGFGMVVDLDGTGSNQVPAFLREWLLTEMRRNNVGSTRFDTGGLSPRRALSDLGSAVVAIEGFIPPGASVGTKFDLLITMIDQNSTSLAGGRLFWPTTLTENGLNTQLLYIKPLASGYGPIYVNPAREDDQEIEFLRQAVVINGGTVTEAQQIQMVLNQKSYLRSRQIADRINERFPLGREDRLPTAVAKSDLLIHINIPRRFSDDPEMLLELIGHMYLDPSPGFGPIQAQRLAIDLLENPEGRSAGVVAAWKTMGRTITPVLRQMYRHENSVVRVSALEAGAWLQDPQAVDPLIELAQGEDPALRVRSARWLVGMTGVTRARVAVREMLEDNDPAIRIGAYEALSLVGDLRIERTAVGQGEQFKFFIDRVRSDKPLIFATQADTPAIVIFGQDLGFLDRVFALVGDHLMIRTIAVDSIRAATVGMHASETAFIPVHWRGRLEQLEQEAQASLGADPLEPVFEVELGDREGQVIRVRVRGQAALDTMRSSLLDDLPFSAAAAPSDPAAIAVVRLVAVPRAAGGGQEDGYVGELLSLQSTDQPLPLAVRYRKPGGTESQTYRITPTVATLAYTLGYDRSDRLAKLGPDLPYSTVVQTLYQLCRSGLIPASILVDYNELAYLIEEAQRAGVIDERPEVDLIVEPTPDAPGDTSSGGPSPPAAEELAWPPSPAGDERPE